MTTKGQPLIYSCSGCSSAAQLANCLAIRMDRREIAEMSCIAGLGGDVKPLVRIAKSRRPIAIIDGCSLHCSLHTLARHGLKADLHWDLSRKGVVKRIHEDFDKADVTRLEAELVLEINELIDIKGSGSNAKSDEI